MEEDHNEMKNSNEKLINEVESVHQNKNEGKDSEVNKNAEEDE